MLIAAMGVISDDIDMNDVLVVAVFRSADGWWLVDEDESCDKLDMVDALYKLTLVRFNLIR